MQSPSIIPIPSEYVEGLEAIECAMYQLMEALGDEKIKSIGVYGIRGVGKTTLMKQLNNQLQRNQLFEKVIFVTVSSNPDLERIQSEIAERLDLKFDPEHSLVLRANKLSMRLKHEKAILIILDDVSKRLAIFDVGIPNGTDHKGCKIVLTSQIESVCHEMGTQRNIRIGILSEKDSWSLFKAKAGDVVEFPTLQPVAKLVMSECKGLPLAIVTVGLSLRMNGDSNIWRDALRKLRSSVPNEQEDHVLSSLRFSYDFLDGVDIKLCFLFCCLFPEDRRIDQLYLFWYGIGEGFAKLDENLEDALLKVCAFIHRLKDSGLLLDGYNDKEVKMHDGVRDVAIKISMDDGYGFLVKAGLGLEEWPECDHVEEYKRISLMGNNIRTVPAELKCPNLRTLLLRENKYLENLPENFFKWMPSLLVLDLSNTGIKCLPSSLSCLTNLRTLGLEGCRNLQDVSLLGVLKKLEVLCLNRCHIEELPCEIFELTNLKLLDLSYTELKTIPSGMISKLTHLEILDMWGSFSRWDAVVEGNDGSGRLASLSEIASLHRLTAIQVWLKHKECLLQDISDGPWEQLNRFCIGVGKGSHTNLPDSKRRMSLEISSPILGNWIRVLLERTELLLLRRCEGVNGMEQLDSVVGSSCLEILFLKDCRQMEYLTNFQKNVPQCAFANLKELYLMSMSNLKTLCHGPVPYEGFFGNLRVLEVERCWKLGKALFSYDLLARMQNLEVLKVHICIELQEIFQKKYRQCDHVILPKLRELRLIRLPTLINIWEGGECDVPIGSLHNLKVILVEGCTSLKILFPPSFAKRLDQLEELIISDCQVMERLLLPPTPPTFKNLRKLHILNCNKLKNLFKLSFAQDLQQLESLSVFGCNDMKELISKDEEEEREELDVCKSVFPQLRKLQLQYLPELKSFYPGLGNMLFDFHSLEIIEIKECPQLENLPLGPHSAPNLREIKCSKEWFQGLQWDDDNIRMKLQSRMLGPVGCTIM